MSKREHQTEEPTPQQAPTLSTIERYAQSVAADVMNEPAPENAQAAPEDRQAGILELIPTIISIFKMLMEACPQSEAQLATTIRQPNNLQKAALLSECREQAGFLRPIRTRRLYNSMLARGAATTEADAKALVGEALNFSNLLI
jgi:hypothetical protein